jgi:protein-S-isoprenylcysteine O-methyltransferase Ste14
VKKRTFPPTYLNSLLLLEIAFHWILPIRQVLNPPITYLGLILIVISVALNIYSARFLRQQNTTSSFQETPDKLVVTGPFARSRNPIYLSGVLLSMGIAIFLGSLITFVIPILIFLILNNIHIPDEERKLEEKFGLEFLEYKQLVRRWV